MATANLGSKKDNCTLGNSFLELSQEIADFGKLAGVRIVPYKDPSLPQFCSLPEERKKLILQQLESKVNFLHSAKTEGISFRSNRQLLWHAIKSLNLVPCSDLMSHITDDDIIEIHTLNDVTQIFHSFTFYDKSSYTLEDVYCNTWQNLYDTDPATTGHILNMVNNILDGKIKSTVDPQIPTYCVKEKKSNFFFEVEIQYKYTSPLFDRHKRPFATVSIERLKVLNEEQEDILSNHADLYQEPKPSPATGLHLVR